ncbi:M20 family peptidase [Streptomyces ipomoeae]|jgi:glutamate carboxypeptidase|uniref:Peptidase dimerization domain protein n=3 Tax=Streptomyces ipomoeae TaxID=103232 RepID=L1KXV3_9ACTN|nr:M20 family metallopeptidase [Streptomyces ipomoeae]EKX65295.1 peptidase dimerization domain protein [Streptomyces ipomoeae 91-03]MDX2697443.1 M20 family metallopeptidase [Streptomyces ipomoeae]MDX2840734.1 M20 family metallopeptidase [Streptomyces ipomoeae]TQE15628.1 M20 family peptidase [Streptomyces ipomoeae]
MTASPAPTSPAADLTARAQGVSSEIVADILTLVRHETSSYDLPRLAAGLDLLRELTVLRLGRPDREQRHPGGEYGDTLTLTYTGTGAGHVALVGHYDTVWPTGTLAGWEQPGAFDDGRERLSGPGIFDMKTGLVQGVWALKLARESGAPVPTVTFLFNGDEEIGSLSSRPVIEEVAQKVDATLVLEPSAHGAVKTARKGSGIFQVTATGVEAHAGLAPQDGASAITALAEFVVAAAAVAAPERGTTVNTGLIAGGSATNVVAGRATATIDIRVSSEAEQDRVDAEFDAIEVGDPRVRIDIDHDWNRPPMTLNAASAPLLDLAREVAREQGRGHLPDAAVGGASDANFIAALGLPVLCGLGAIGDGAHAQGEFIHPDTVPAQTALVAGMLGRLAERLPEPLPEPLRG